jgi:hypothetical protein
LLQSSALAIPAEMAPDRIEKKPATKRRAGNDRKLINYSLKKASVCNISFPHKPYGGGTRAVHSASQK